MKWTVGSNGRSVSPRSANPSVAPGLTRPIPAPSSANAQTVPENGVSTTMSGRTLAASNTCAIRARAPVLRRQGDERHAVEVLRADHLKMAQRMARRQRAHRARTGEHPVIHPRQIDFVRRESHGELAAEDQLAHLRR